MMRFSGRLVIGVAGGLGLLVLAGCARPANAPVSASVVEAMSAPAADGYARALAARPFSFPRDHGPHPEYRTEWWYYTGNLTDTTGAAHGYQLTFFRTALAPEGVERGSEWATNQVYMAHFALTDGARQRHDSFDRYSRGAAGLAGAEGAPAYRVWLEDWSAVETAPGVHRLRASAVGEAGPIGLDLTLRATRPPLFHGEDGLHQKGAEPGNASYYYSLVGLESSGVITTAGGAIPVSGVSWMDHEFGTSALGEGALGWDWFSLQLDNGAALMLYGIRTVAGAAPPHEEGTLLLADGRRYTIPTEDFTIQPVAEWTSPTTGITYPAAWQIAVPAHGLELRVTPLLPDQEMDVSFVYWEGAVNAQGTMGGQPVTGRGYAELTGYGQGAGAYQR